jgi:hypothetical protein
MEIMSQINKYEITTLHGKHEQKHIIHALTAQDAIVQFKVKIDCDRYKIVNIEPWVQQWTGEDYMNYVNSQNKIRERIVEQQKSKPTPKPILDYIISILK